MSARSSTIPPASAATSAEARVAAYDWQALAGDLDNYGCAVLPKLLSPEECRAIAALYSDESHFRSHIHMARHGFGKGEYRYFKYPLPDLIGGLRTALYPRLAAVANEWNGRMGNWGALSRRPRLVSQAMSRRRPDAPDTAAAAVCSRRLQLPPPGPLRRSRIPDPGRDPSLRAGQGFHRWRVRARPSSGRACKAAPRSCHFGRAMPWPLQSITGRCGDRRATTA